MARLEDIRGLAEAHASSISSSPRDWMNYLQKQGIRAMATTLPDMQNVKENRFFLRWQAVS